MTNSEMLSIIFMAVILFIYLLAFYKIIFQRDLQYIVARKFYNAICNIHKDIHNQTYSSFEILEQFNLNYEKLCQDYPNNSFISILDLLEKLIYYYDTYSDRLFKNIFKVEKKTEVKLFMINMRSYIKDRNPFISIPKKEADLMDSIQNALENNNESLGTNSLKHLSQEIENKEKLFIKQNKANQRANIVSIVGVILTIFFGILSFINFK